MKNLLRNLILKLDKKLDLPRYRVKQDHVVVHVTENYVIVTQHDKEHGTSTSMKMTIDTYFGVRDQIKSYRRKHEKHTSDTITSP